MIKAQARIRGTVTQAATILTNKDGERFLCFSLTLTIPGARNNMPGKEIVVSVSVNGTEEEASRYAVNTRIEATGTLAFRKRDENLYLNLHADSVTSVSDEKDGIEGTLEFKGTVGNKLESKTDKKGKNFVSFSAFSTEKVNDALNFTWVRFIRFDHQCEEWLRPKAKVEARGKLVITAYNGRINLDCHAEDWEPWERLPYAAAGMNDKPTF